MTVKQIKTLFIEELKHIYPESEISTFYFWIMEDKFGLKKTDISLNPKFEVDSSKIKKIESVLSRLKTHEPIQHIIGYSEFFGLKFKVNPDVLIPRPETEQLVEWVIEDLKNENPKCIVDIGTGSGCIPISLKKNLPMHIISGIDISEKALDTATKNAGLNNVKVNFLKTDILALDKLDDNIDVIVSNPPYVLLNEKNKIQKNVLDFEPHLALFVGDNNPFLFYEKIVNLAKKHPKDVTVYFEISQYLKKEFEQLMQYLNINTVEIRKDFRGNYRMAKVLLQSNTKF